MWRRFFSLSSASSSFLVSLIIVLLVTFDVVSPNGWIDSAYILLWTITISSFLFSMLVIFNSFKQGCWEGLTGLVQLFSSSMISHYLLIWISNLVNVSSCSTSSFFWFRMMVFRLTSFSLWECRGFWHTLVSDWNFASFLWKGRTH